MAKARQKQKAKTKAKITEPKKIAHPDAKPPVDNAAQIAVHWKEEEYFQPSAKFIGQANLNDPAMVERFSEKHFPECFREYADLLDWDTYWHTTLDTNRSALLEMVCRRQTKRLLQLRRPSSREI